MTATITAELGHIAPTGNARLLSWVREVAELPPGTGSSGATGSDAEWDRTTARLVEAGTFVKLDDAKRPNSFWAASGCCSRPGRDAGAAIAVSDRGKPFPSPPAPAFGAGDDDDRQEPANATVTGTSRPGL